MNDEQMAALREKYCVFDQETITVDDFDAAGFILDIGGGGEGIIGLLKGDRVVAIDPQKRELEEAPDGPLKVVGDARALPFLDGSFETATAFFSLMFLKSREDIEKVLAEAHRVLRPGGRLLIWDANISRPADTDKEAYVTFLRVLVGDREIGTGYGQPWPDEPHDPTFYVTAAEAAGFDAGEVRKNGRFFHVELVKPQ